LRDDREPRAPSQTAATLAREAERWDTPLAVPDGVIVDPLGDPTVPLATHAPGARILVVDDSVDMREYLRRLLAGRWRVDVAGDGEQALAMMRAHKPDLVVADVMMPNLDGFALLRAVRADEALRHTPVVLVTARAGEDAAIEGLMAGADDYIAKPFSARELVVRVGGQLELSRMRRRAGEVNAFLLRFSDAARGLPDAAAVAQIACRMILEQLGAERACWSEVDWAAGESVLTGACDASGGTVPDGRVPLDTREPLTAVHLEGRPVVVDDTQADPGVPAPAKKRFARSDVGAELVAPVMVDGTVRCTLAVQDRRPRRWTPEDIALVESVAGRCWTEVERTRAETRSDELERFSRVTVGRELRMIELKRQINRLQAQLGEPPQFPLGFDDEGDGHEHASAERLRRVMETEAVALLFFTSDGTLIDANDGFFRKTGYSRERVAEGRLHRRDMTPPEWVGVSEAQMQRLEETGRFGPYDKEYLRADGSRAWMRVSGRDLGDGTIVEIAIDIPRAS
jgi:PAS domain S-box-containing protein